ncbi:MAG: HD domain-containing protein [Acidobacteria bacterium]|nr:HD domain-containing protein [Acidobacteriota bacterium]
MPLRISPRFVLRFVAIAIVYGALNHLAAAFRVVPGISMVYPASAVGVAAALVWPWESALAVFVATLLTPWSSQGSLVMMLVYAVGNTVEAVFPALILKPRKGGSDAAVFLKLLVWAVMANTLLNVVICRGPKILAGIEPLNRAAIRAGVMWWSADAIAIMILALPLLLWLRPDLFFDDSSLISWHFLRRRGLVLKAVALIAAVSVLIYLHDTIVGGSYNWPALLYLVPLAILLVDGGLPAGALGNAIMALLYLLTLGFESSVAGISPLQSPHRLIVVYGNLLVFWLFTVIAGTMRTRNIELTKRLHQQWEDTKEGLDVTVVALAAALEASDVATVHHVERVGLLASEIASEMGLDESFVDKVRYAAILHDVGKVGVPTAILRKPDSLTAEEYAVMEEHLDLGAQILNRCGLPGDVSPMVRYHEERWDGQTSGRFAGHFGLKGEEIPLGARIVAVADAFDAMVSNRPYRGAMTVAKAVRELEREAGRQFDPNVVRSFLRVLRRRGLNPADSGGFVIAPKRRRRNVAPSV